MINGIWFNWALQATRNARDVTGKIQAWLNEPSAKELATLEKEAHQRQVVFENARRFCDDCKTEVANLDASYCPKCGSSSISSRSQIREREKAQEQRIRQERHDEEARVQAAKAAEQQESLRRQQTAIRTDSARTRCREIAAWKFCSRCRTERDPAHEFCIKCGGIVAKIPMIAAFELANKEFPDCVRTEKDFRQLAG